MDRSERDHFVPHSMHIPYTPDGLGTYSAEALCFYKTNAKAIPLVLEAIKSSLVKPGSVFTIVDFGAADGGTSMLLMYESVKAIREKYGEEMPITIIYEDQPVNDYKSVFMRMQGFIPGPRSYLMDFQNVFVMACGTNFYSQCLPRNSVHFGFSATSVHWLREKPCDITGALHHSMMTDPREKEMFSKQGEKDWELFLMNRAEELAPGGYMLLVQDVFDEDGKLFGHSNMSKISAYNVHKNICSLWKEFVQEGKITQDEFNHTTFVSYNRKLEEFKKPFNDPNSPVRRKGLEWVSFEKHVIPCEHKERWMRDKGDPKEHAKRYVASIRIWTNATFIEGLSNSRSAEEKSNIVDDLYHRYESLVAKHPEDHEFYFLQAYIVLRKHI
ncbi:probable caffeine synthase 2 isoform X2 [Exaiptasia diaphana]|uniref:Uncharacterized protein n=1 Tax=Exaiptasia diaphana TaxID=2652724 RepID=A0A913YJL1_EXADI|nr:probable caffeine synthase 2 isoform X2 [Exaiptasia diaphana]